MKMQVRHTAAILADMATNKRISHILSAPWGYGQQKPGVEKGAEHLIKLLRNIHRNVTSDAEQFKIENEDVGKRIEHISYILSNNVKTLKAESFLKSNAIYHNALFEARKKLFGNTLIVGGDHSVAIGSVLGTLAMYQSNAEYMPHLYDSDDSFTKHRNEPKVHVLSGVTHETKLSRNRYSEINQSIKSINMSNDVLSDEELEAMSYQEQAMYRMNLMNKEGSNFKFNNSKVGLIWIDAHADINTLSHSHSGNIHGMPLSFITGIEDAWPWIRSIDNNSKLSFSDLYYWGIRDLDSYEKGLIEKYGIKTLRTVRDLKNVVKNYDLIHTSLDIDGLDPKWAASTGTVVPDGLNIDDVLDYLSFVMDSGKSICIDLVEYNPEIGTKEQKAQTEQTMREILNVLF